MSAIRRYLSMALAAISLLILGFIVSVAARSRPGTSTDDPLFELESALDFDATRIFAWIIIAMAILGAVLFVLGLKQSKPQEGKKKRSILGLILGVAAFFLIFRYLQPLSQTLLESPEVTGAGEAVGEPAAESGGSSSWLFSLLVAAVIAAALTRVGVSVRESDATFEIEPPTLTNSDPSFRLASPVSITLGTDPRSRVLAAYSRFEHSASETGVPRRSSETAHHHARRATRELGLDRSVVNGLMGRYGRTRFGFGSVSAEQASDAEDLSDRLCREMLR